MDKQLLKAYIRTIVEEEVQRILPDMLSEAVSEIKKMKPLQENTKQPAQQQGQKPKLDRSKLASMMGLSYDGETLRATTSDTMAARLPEGAPVDADPTVVNAINRNYSDLMKAMKIV